jgi:endonuclease YncB( thermonuclease family)
LLLRVGSKRERTFYVKQTESHGWSVRQLESHVQEGLYDRVTGTDTELAPLPHRRLYTYPVVADDSGQVRLDLGFGICCGPAVVALDAVAQGDMAESRGTESPDTVPFAAHRVELDEQEADTYLARVRRVVDGDTLVVTVELGFGVEVVQTLRLRGIDAPELSRPAGVRARAFVRESLSASERVVIVTSHRDKYGRWLADLYYHPNWRDGKRIVSRGRWLNRELVEQGLAARYGG